MKADFHIHTCFSPDSVNPPKDILRVARERGLGAIAITDHGEFLGALETKKVAKGMKKYPLVILGMEVRADAGDLIGLFLQEKVKATELEAACDEIRSQDGIVVLPHPFDSLRGSSLSHLPKKVDGIEVVNARVMNWEYNEKAELYADENRIARIGGSDAHFLFEIGNAYTLIDAKDEEGIRKAILKNTTRAEGRRAPIYAHGTTTAVKFLKSIGLEKIIPRL